MLQEEIQEEELAKARQAQLWATQDWVKEGEYCSRKFFRMLKAKNLFGKIQVLYNNQGELQTTLDELHHVAKLFYTDIFNWIEYHHHNIDGIIQANQSWVFE